MKSLQLANKKSKRNLTKKSIKKNSKNKNRFFFWGGGGGGGILSLLFSCYALAALQSPTIIQDIRHKTTTRSTISTLSSFNDNSMLQKEKKRQRLGGSTYTGAGRVRNTTVFYPCTSNLKMASFNGENISNCIATDSESVLFWCIM